MVVTRNCFLSFPIDPYLTPEGLRTQRQLASLRWIPIAEGLIAPPNSIAFLNWESRPKRQGKAVDLMKLVRATCSILRPH